MLPNSASILRDRHEAEQELRAVQEALRASGERTRNILESITDGFAVVDGNWQFTYVNAKAEEFFRPLAKTRHNLLGRNIWDEFPDLRDTSVEETYRRAKDQHTTAQLEFFYPALQSWFEIRVYPAQTGLSIYFQDVTRRKDAEGLLACEKSVLGLMTQRCSMRSILEALTLEIERVSMNGMLCCVLRLDESGERLLHGAGPSLPHAYNDAIHGMRIGPAAGSCGTAAFERGPIDALDIATDPRWSDFRSLAALHGLATCCSTPVVSADGEVLGTVAMYFRNRTTPSERDRSLMTAATRLAGIVLERSRAEQTLRKSEEFTRSIVESSPDCIKTLDLHGELVWINSRARAALGGDREVVGASWIDLWNGDDHRQAQEAIATAAAGGIAKFLGHFAVEGQARWWNVIVSPILGSGGSPEQLLVVSRDVTDRIEAEHQLRENEAELRALADSIPQLAWIARADGEIFWYNQQWYDYTGTTLESMQGWGWRSVHDPAILPEVMRRWQHSIASGSRFEMEFPLRGADGSFRSFLTRVNPVRDRDGRVIRWFGTNTDVDQVRRVRDALQEETRTLELLNRTGTTLASSLDLHALVQTITDAATELTGASFGAFFYNTTDENGDSFMLYTLSGAPREAFSRFGQPRATALFGPTFRGEGIIRIDDVLADDRYGKMPPHYGMPVGHLPVRSYLAAPVTTRSGEVLGGLIFGHPEVAVFSARSERLLEAVAAQAAVAIDNARLYQAAQRAAEEREALLNSERSSRAEAERASRMKDEFLATLSHELRTPLSSILGWAHVLRSGRASSADLDKGLDVIERNARAQAQLIDDLLDMSRIISGKVRLDVQSVEPASFIDAAIETVRLAAEAKDIRLEKLLDAGPFTISGDPNRLQQIVWNLLANAIKFTPKGGKVQIVLERVNSHLEISVADTGVGIAPEFLSHVFDRFRQADSSTTRRFGGLGLGLSIVKHLVELHGGTVRVHSEGEGAGATFTVHLPLAVVHRSQEVPREHPRAPVAQRAELQHVDLAGVRILIVDDQSDARELIARVLSECNAEVLTCATAEEGLEVIEKARPTLLISDIGMPGTDGYEFLRQVRALGTSKGGAIPAIALTAFARSEDRTRALRAGFLVHLSKPVELAELIATVASVTGRFAH
ncbi:MAG: PAS domain-containing protein [Pseudomonadota bacterium]|nr:PAS domain-containing protein [Pseudomonadota bacterium]